MPGGVGRCRSPLPFGAQYGRGDHRFDRPPADGTGAGQGGPQRRRNPARRLPVASSSVSPRPETTSRSASPSSPWCGRIRCVSVRSSGAAGGPAAERTRGGDPRRGTRGPLQGLVSRISPALDVSNRTLTVEIDVPNPGPQLRVGLFAEAAVVVDPKAQSLAIPGNTVREFAGVEKVWVVQAGQAAERVVTTGRRDGDWVEVLTGLAAGDNVVRQPQEDLAGPVVVRPSNAVAAATK